MAAEEEVVERRWGRCRMIRGKINRSRQLASYVERIDAVVVMDEDAGRETDWSPTSGGGRERHWSKPTGEGAGGEWERRGGNRARNGDEGSGGG